MTLERIFHVERNRRQAASIAHGGGFATPVISERRVTSEDLPILVTNMRGMAVQPGIRNGRVRFAFSECSLEDESKLLVGLQARIIEGASRPSRSPFPGAYQMTLKAAVAAMTSQGYQPRYLVLARDRMAPICPGLDGKSIDELVLTMGCVAEIEGGLQVLPGPPGVILLLAAPGLAGIYSRVDDRVGLMVTRIGRAVMVVNDLD